MDYFFDKTCNINSTTTTYPNWEATQTPVAIYTWITCDFYENKWGYRQDWFVVEGSHTTYTLVLKGDKINVRKWHIVEIIDWVSLWDFIIDTILINRNINGLVDNIECKLSEKRK